MSFCNASPIQQEVEKLLLSKSYQRLTVMTTTRVNTYVVDLLAQWEFRLYKLCSPSFNLGDYPV